MNYHSPLRYPGGKARLAQLLKAVIKSNKLAKCAYYEPYAGGAGAALGLLNAGIVEQLFLNDADRRVYSFWRSVLDENARFADKVQNVPMTIDEWHRQAAICSSPNGYACFDVGFAAFFMNRCNRSGVLTGAGPIGGYKQEGTWNLGVRFNRVALSQRIIALGRLRHAIHISNQDAIAFLKNKLPFGLSRRKVFVYLDPPYVRKGQRLYLNFYGAADHTNLARYLLAQKMLHWLTSYDDSDLVRDLYASCVLKHLPIKYSLQVKRSAHELVIAPQYLALPAEFRTLPRVSQHRNKAS